MNTPESLFKKAALLGAAFLLAVTGCSGLLTQERALEATSEWAAAHGFSTVTQASGDFVLYALLRQLRPAETLTVYVEGDGAAWRTPYHPPRDPTPSLAVSLLLADIDPSPAVAYLARPCQYLGASALSRCDSAYWTGKRFAPEVIASFDGALTRLKERAGAKRVRLVGYSGGGVIAAILAARRSDVISLITLASPLALSDWAAAQELSPLAGSLDPIAVAAGHVAPPSVHFAGADDEIVPPAIVERYARTYGSHFEIVAGFNHACCWVRDWRQLLRRAQILEVIP